MFTKHTFPFKFSTNHPHLHQKLKSKFQTCVNSSLVSGPPPSPGSPPAWLACLHLCKNTFWNISSMPIFLRVLSLHLPPNTHEWLHGISLLPAIGPNETLLALHCNCLVNSLSSFLTRDSLEWKLSDSPLYSQCPAQTLACIRHLINIYWMLIINGKSTSVTKTNHFPLGLCNLAEILYRAPVIKPCFLPTKLFPVWMI